MTQPRLSDVIYSPMRVIIAPTDLTIGYQGIIQNESYNDLETVLWLGDQEIMGFNLEEWNEDAIPLIFPYGATGANTGKPVIRKRLSGSLHPGQKFDLISGQRQKILFAAEAETKDPSYLYYSTVVARGPSASARLAISAQWLYPVIMMALEDGSGRYSDSGLLEDLEL